MVIRLLVLKYIKLFIIKKFSIQIKLVLLLTLSCSYFLRSQYITVAFNFIPQTLTNKYV